MSIWHFGPEPTEGEQKSHYDVCIVGSGAAGSVAAHRMSQMGLHVLILEQGPYIQAHTTYEDVLMASEKALARQPNGCWALNGYPWSTCNVGGGTIFYGGASFRYRLVDFDASAHFPDADLPVVWPYTYGDLEPYYDKIENHVGIAADPSKDPFGPPTRISNLPPVAPSPSAKHILRGAGKLGLKGFPTPLAIATVSYRGRPACDNSQPCIEHRCPSGSKGDVYTCFLRETLQAPRVRLFAGMKAVRLERRQEGSIESIVALRTDTKQTYRFSAKVFVVACNAIQSAALLLRSADQWSPSGIGNEHDMVGRGLCMKLNEYVTGFVHGRANDDVEDVTAPEGVGPFSTVSLMDYYLDESIPTGMGGMIYENRYGQSYSMRPHGAVVRLECMIADQPSRKNRVLLSRKLDDFGLPLLAIDYTAHPRDLVRLEAMIERCTAILEHADCRWIRREATDFHLGSCHLHGTCRSGREPRSSVLDTKSRVHSVENLYVIDGAYMPFASAVNPTHTIQAHSLKSTEGILQTHWKL